MGGAVDGGKQVSYLTDVGWKVDNAIYNLQPLVEGNGVLQHKIPDID